MHPVLARDGTNIASRYGNFSVPWAAMLWQQMITQAFAAVSRVCQESFEINEEFSTVN
jgi:hypothetical protein